MRALMAAGLVLALLALLITAQVVIFRGEIADWVKPERSLTMIGVLGGFIILAWQLDRQHRNSLVAEAVKSRNALWLQIYSELADASEKASQGLRDVPASRAVMAVKLRFPTAPAFHEISDARFDATHKVLALLRKMEKWEIALGGDFQAFKKVLSHSLNAWGECADQLALVLMPYVSQPQNVPAPTENVVQKLTALDLELMAKALAVEVVLWDLRIASQNRLLGGLFTYRVPIRQPGDPNMEVVAVPEEHIP